MQIPKGDFIAFLGQNGSGKTTLLKQINGLLCPTRGEILVQEKPVQKIREQNMPVV